MTNLAEKIKNLPPETKKEVEDFVDFLMEEHGCKHKLKKLKNDMDWGVKRIQKQIHIFTIAEKSPGMVGRLN